jgi:hypothetical protein
MRYISHISNYMIQKNNGDLCYVFGPDGVLLVGSATTASGAGNYIDASANPGDTSLEINLPYATDLDGNAVTRLEMAGLGTLTKVTKTSASLTNFVDGYRLFFEAPILSSGATPVAGAYYKVLSGTVTYNSVAYAQNEEFVGVDQAGNTSGTGTCALCIPPELKNVCDPWRTEHFKIKTLKDGTESNEYWNWDTSGFNPMDSLTTSDADFYAFTN